jgi:LysR family glycine cleavage system transcriptional activator
MIASSRFLPSIASLRALEALDRLDSASAVAKELGQTQSAVSRQLQALEAQLGTSLILRKPKRMQLTPEGRQYATSVRGALQAISRASIDLTLSPQGGNLTLAILPTFGMRWLVPRLADFTRRYPDITINMATRLRPFDFADEQFDAALHFGAADWPDADHLQLKTEMTIPVCAPGLLGGVSLPSIAKISALPLLHIATRPTAWQDWFAAHGACTTQVGGTVYDQFSTIIQAALHGLGVALLPNYLVEQDLATGRLIVAYGQSIKSSGSYFLVWPNSRARHPALLSFRSWLATQSEDEDTLPR